MSQPDVDWDDLSALWREQTPARASLVRRVRTHTVLMWSVTATEVGMLLLLPAFSRWYLATGSSPLKLALLAVLWLVSIGIAGFSIWNRSGSWRADSETTQAYLALVERRARAKVRVARFIRVVSGLQACLVVALVWVVVAESANTSSAVRVVLAGALAGSVATGYALWSIWYERRASREIVEVAAARELLDK